MKDRAKNSKILRILFLYVLLTAFLFSTDPSKLPLAMLLVPFVLLFLGIFGTIYYGFALADKAGKLPKPKRLVIAGCLALMPVILLILKSINQLTLRDVLIFGVFIIALIFYVTRTHLVKP